MLERWRELDVFHESLRRREGSPHSCSYEGPPTANGRPGSHHVLARVFKDLFPRYKTMRGYQVPRKAGWDCHGLPVELEVEKRARHQLEGRHRALRHRGVQRAVPRVGVAYVEEWNRLTERIGFWIDLDDAYCTLDQRLHRVGLVGAQADLGQGPALRGLQGRPVLPALRHGALVARGRARLPRRRSTRRLRALPARRRRPLRRATAARLDDDALDAGPATPPSRSTRS